MFSSIRSRLLLTYFLLIATILGIVTLALVLFLIRNPRLAREAETNLILAADAIGRQQNGPAATPDRAQLAIAAQEADELLNVRVLVFSNEGTLIIDSRSDTTSPLDLSNAQTRRAGAIEIRETNDQSGNAWLFVTRQFQRGMTLIVATPKPRAELLAFFSDELFTPILRAGAIALVLSIILAILLTRSITSPLEQVMIAARQLAKGKLQTIEPGGPSELQSLARTFNEMGHNVVTSQQTQREFVANVSHELRTPLTSIQGFAQAILDGTAHGKEAVAKAAQVIVDEAGRMQSLVADLLDLARLDAGAAKVNLQEVNVAALLNQVITKFAPMAAQAKLDLRVEVEPNLMLQGNFERLSQVVSNLVDNAIKFSPPGAPVILAAGKNKDLIEITVSDSGPGIPEKEAHRIFERFYQVDKSRKAGGRGAGLGLSIAQQIVSAHQGTIQVVSPKGGGARFVVQLPIHPR